MTKKFDYKIVIPPGIWEKLDKKAYAKGCSIQELVYELINQPTLDSNVVEAVELVQETIRINPMLSDVYMVAFNTIKQELSNNQSTINAIEELIHYIPNDIHDLKTISVDEIKQILEAQNEK